MSQRRSEIINPTEIDQEIWMVSQKTFGSGRMVVTVGIGIRNSWRESECSLIEFLDKRLLQEM
jgi:hypothetical protein